MKLRLRNKLMLLQNMYKTSLGYSFSGPSGDADLKTLIFTQNIRKVQNGLLRVVEGKQLVAFKALLLLVLCAEKQIALTILIGSI